MNKTFIVGDFHGGNLIWVQNTPEVLLKKGIDNKNANRY